MNDDLFVRYYFKGMPTDYSVNPITSEVYSDKSGKILKPIIDRNGYTNYRLYIDGESHYVGIHQMVAQTCIPNDDPSKTEVDHIIGDKSKNSIFDLEWVTRKENVRRSVALGLKPPSVGEKNGSSVYSDAIVEKIVELLLSGMSIIDVAGEMDVPTQFVYKIVNGDTRTNATADITFPDTVYRDGKRRNKRLTEDQVLEVIKLRNKGYTQSKVAELLNVSTNQVQHCVHYKSKRKRSSTGES